MLINKSGGSFIIEIIVHHCLLIFIYKKFISQSSKNSKSSLTPLKTTTHFVIIYKYCLLPERIIQIYNYIRNSETKMNILYYITY